MVTSYDDAVANGQVMGPVGNQPNALGTPVGNRREPRMVDVYADPDQRFAAGAINSMPSWYGRRRPMGAPKPTGQRQDGWDMVPTPARYFEGDEYTLASTLPPEDRARIQQQMKDAGLVNPNTRLVWGEWDATSANAFQQVLSMANINGMTWQEQMNRLDEVAADHPDTSEGSQRPALTIRQTSPEDLRVIFNDTATRVLGRKATEDELERMISGYNSRETAQQTSMYSATYSPDGKPGGGGTIVDTPAPDAFAESELRALNPGEAGGAEIANTFDAFERILNRMGTSDG